MKQDMKEVKCPPVCDDTGAYKKVDMNLKDIQDMNAAKTQGNPADSAQATNNYDQPPTGPEPREEILPGLEPGPDGKPDWTVLADMTGTRPGVNKYSIARYSLEEWRRQNQRVLDQKTIIESNIVDYNAKTAMMKAFGMVDKLQNDNTKRLRQKAKDIFRWKVEVERAVRAITEEVRKLEAERQRLKGAAKTLMLPEAISQECLEMRSNKLNIELVSDLAEIELKKEYALVEEVRSTFKQKLKEVEEQLAKNKAAKQRIEYDFCDKELAYTTETLNLKLDKNSNTIMWKPGATKFGENTAPLEYWEYFCRESIQICESCRQQSMDMRAGLSSLLENGGRKLRTQADNTDKALAETIAVTQEICTKLEETLRVTLQRIADMECLILDLKAATMKMDAAMKLAQTRLDNRNNCRPHGENVRDTPHTGLLDEVKKIHETVSSLLGQLRNAERVREDLIVKRRELEKEIASKRKNLNTDRARCGFIRTHYPSALQLAGH